MSKAVIQELMELQKRGIEPFMTPDGWELFWKLVVEDEEKAEKSA
jgi:hypothetical protein